LVFGFAYPGLLGALDVFERGFAEPTRLGGHASAYEVYRAYNAAVGLREMIRPYLLRRMKREVAADLPGKSEQILFVNLTEPQVRAYRDFLDSPVDHRIMSSGTGSLCFMGVDYLRNVCNHPALLEEDAKVADIEQSAKLKLLAQTLPRWARGNHRALLFAQYLKMLDFVGQTLDAPGRGSPTSLSEGGRGGYARDNGAESACHERRRATPPDDAVPAAARHHVKPATIV